MKFSNGRFQFGQELSVAGREGGLMRGIIRALVRFGLGCEIYRCRVVALLDCTVHRERPLMLMPHPLSLRFFMSPTCT